MLDKAYDFAEKDRQEFDCYLNNFAGVKLVDMLKKILAGEDIMQMLSDTGLKSRKWNPGFFT